MHLTTPNSCCCGSVDAVDALATEDVDPQTIVRRRSKWTYNASSVPLSEMDSLMIMFKANWSDTVTEEIGWRLSLSSEASTSNDDDDDDDDRDDDDGDAEKQVAGTDGDGADDHEEPEHKLRTDEDNVFLSVPTATGIENPNVSCGYFRPNCQRKAQRRSFTFKLVRTPRRPKRLSKKLLARLHAMS